MRLALVAAAVLLIASVALVLAGPALGPIMRSCSPSLDQVACEGAVEAVRRRGLPALHPLILSAHVEPGSAPDPGDLGHRATVRFDLLGVPGATSVSLHYDQGAHWGGVSDRSETELAAWTLAPLLLGGLGAAAIVGLAGGRRRATTG